MSVTSIDWSGRAACRGMDPALFFGPDGEHERDRQVRVERAKAVCSTCPVARDCITFATGRNTGFGVWGGQDLEMGGRLCRNGLHLMSAANTYVSPGGGKNCRECRNISDQRSRARQRRAA